MIQNEKTTKDADMLSKTGWTDRIDYKTVKFLYGICDGAEILKGGEGK